MQPNRQGSETIQVACAACLTANRVPAQRAGEDPKCGKCGAALLPVKVNTEEARGLASRLGRWALS